MPSTCASVPEPAPTSPVHYFHGRLLAERDDVAGARPHVETAIAIGEEIGMTGPFGVVAAAATSSRPSTPDRWSRPSSTGWRCSVVPRDPQLEALAARLEPAEYGAGEVLFAEGDAGQTFVILLDGAVAVSRDALGLGLARRRCDRGDLR